MKLLMKLENKNKIFLRFSINTDESGLCESEFKNFLEEVSVWKARIFWNQKTKLGNQYKLC